MSTLEITTTLFCPNICKFCPQDKLLTAYKSQRNMSLSGFMALLANVPKSVRIDFSGFCEPFANEFAINMMNAASCRGYKISVYTTLIGADVSAILRLVSIKPEELVIHIPDKEKLCVFPVTPQYYDLLRLVAESGAVTAYHCHGEPTDEVKEIIGGAAVIWHEINDRAGNVDCATKVHIPGAVSCRTCGDSFNHNVLLPNGDVYLCCMDFGLSCKLGNLFINSYSEIMDSAAMQRHKNNAADKNVDCLCNACIRAKGR